MGASNSNSSAFWFSICVFGVKSIHLLFPAALLSTPLVLWPRLLLPLTLTRYPNVTSLTLNFERPNLCEIKFINLIQRKDFKGRFQMTRC